MTVPKYFRKKGERGIISYDYFDIAEGTGVKKFKGASVTNDTTTSFILLSDQEVYSSLISTSKDVVDIATSPGTKMIDVDIDLSVFNIPKDVEGNVYVNFCYYLSKYSGANYEGWFVVKVKKNDVEIGSARTASTNTTTKEIVTLKIPVTRTHYAKGDVLRITVESWAISTDASDVRSEFGHDPQNRDGTNITPSTDSPTTITKFEVLIPFLLDL